MEQTSQIIADRPRKSLGVRLLLLPGTVLSWIWQKYADQILITSVVTVLTSWVGGWIYLTLWLLGKA